LLDFAISYVYYIGHSKKVELPVIF